MNTNSIFRPSSVLFAIAGLTLSAATAFASGDPSMDCSFRSANQTWRVSLPVGSPDDQGKMDFDDGTDVYISAPKKNPAWNAKQAKLDKLATTKFWAEYNLWVAKSKDPSFKGEKPVTPTTTPQFLPYGASWSIKEHSKSTGTWTDASIRMELVDDEGNKMNVDLGQAVKGDRQGGDELYIGTLSAHLTLAFTGNNKTLANTPNAVKPKMESHTFDVSDVKCRYSTGG